jgi:hypothetical protein
MKGGQAKGKGRGDADPARGRYLGKVDQAKWNRNDGAGN